MDFEISLVESEMHCAHFNICIIVCSGFQTEIISSWVCFIKLFSKDNLNMSLNTLNAFWRVGEEIIFTPLSLLSY